MAVSPEKGHATAQTSSDASNRPGSERDEAAKRARIDRRLRQEYHEHVRVLGDLVNENIDAPYTLAAVRFNGATATRDSFLEQICAPYLAASPRGLRAVLQASVDLNNVLSRFRCFDEVQSRLERSPSMLAEEGDLDLVLQLKEAKRMFLHAGTEVGNSEGSATARARLVNAFGGDETLEGAISLGTKTRSNVQMTLELPIPTEPSPDTRVELSGFAVERDQSHFASCKEHVRGIAARLRTLTRFGSHELAAEVADRHLTDFEPHASLTMRRAAGHSVKSSLAHTLLLQRASGAGHVKLAQEYAGLGGDAHHLKLSGEVMTAQSIMRHSTLTANARGGLLYPLNGRPSLFSDRFRLGGPTSIRSFQINGIGPKDNGDFLGGDLCWSAGLSLFTPVPRRQHWPVLLHSFANAGRLETWQSNRTIAGNLSQLLHRPVTSAGFGLVYSPGQNIRLEVNFALPLTASASDATRKGFAVGFGIDFL